jgi:1-acyl-sn-glycerol-3-phosphate acyltransferase
MVSRVFVVSSSHFRYIKVNGGGRSSSLKAHSSSGELSLIAPVKYLPRLFMTAVGVILITVTMAPAIILLGLIRLNRKQFKVVQWWARGIAKFMGISFSVVGGEKADPAVSYIIAPNHQSHTDILAMVCCSPVPFRWVAKKELLKIPFFGWALASTGAIALNRSNREQSIQRLRNAGGKLKDGWSIMIFPEGTRSPDGTIQDFKKGPFMMAVQTEVPILPVTCNGAYKVLPKKTLQVTPGRITVTLGDPIPTSGLTEKDVPELMEKTRAAVLANFDPQYDPFA